MTEVFRVEGQTGWYDVRVDLEVSGQTGVCYATSQDMRGLLVSGGPIEQTLDNVADALIQMAAAEGRMVIVVRQR